MQTLTQPELGIMQTLWEAKEALPRAAIQNQLSHLNWKVSTFNTYLNRLQEKGFISSESRGQTSYYRPSVSREAYRQAEGKWVLGKVFGGSLKNFVLSVSATDAVQEKDLEELYALLEQMRGESGDGR